MKGLPANTKGRIKRDWKWRGERERRRRNVCVCVCVCERERERDKLVSERFKLIYFSDLLLNSNRRGYEEKLLKISPPTRFNANQQASEMTNWV